MASYHDIRKRQRVKLLASLVAAAVILLMLVIVGSAQWPLARDACTPSCKPLECDRFACSK